MDLQIEVEVMLNQLGVGTGGKIMIDEQFQMTVKACSVPMKFLNEKHNEDGRKIGKSLPPNVSSIESRSK